MTQTRRAQFPAWMVVLVLSALSIITFSVLLIMGTLKLVPEPPYAPEDPFILYVLTAFNFVAFAVFSFILARQLIRLRQERRARRLGSRLKSRLIRHFIIISILPLVFLGLFSYLFINVTIDKWFGEPYQNVLRDSGYIFDQYMKDEISDSRQMTQTLRASLEDAQDPAAMAARIAGTTDNPKLLLLQIVDGSGNVVLSRPMSEVDLPEATTFLLSKAQAGVLTGKSFTEQIPGQQDKFFFVVSAAPFKTRQGGIITLYQPLPALAERAANIAREHERYERLYRKQGQIRRTTFQVLGLITFLLLFAATWTAMHLAKGITLPIQALAEATRKVALGDFSQTIDCLAEDELALLVKSFNRMIAQLKESREQLEQTAERLRETNLTLEERRRYIETVLESLSTGIISVDAEHRITTINRAAMRILHLAEIPPDQATIVRSLAPVLRNENVKTLERMIQKTRRTSFAAEDIELESPTGVSHLVLSASALRDEEGRLQGLVVMIEDITELVRAQRQAVWSEVARRMAHEIKNPLTPIQLSAERIARNLERSGPLLDQRYKQMIDECTFTIVNEVRTLQRMVDEFARFARLPRAVMEETSLNQVVTATVRLYEDRLNGVVIESRLADDLPPVKLDAEQIKRALVNLIDNAIEAVQSVEGEQRITVETQYLRQQELAQIVVSDTGIGIDPKDYPKLFTPYFSKRAHGTGLGLAIVNRIVAEHRGTVRVKPNHPRGSRFIIELPVSHSLELKAVGS
ncbi:MAG: HAMP domain-containing protein [Acidobacteria bacterium]|nr:HAMP domain-containing protein [Acidobacteriota bacterium]